ARVLADVESFIGREANADGLRNFALGDLFFINQERRCRAPADATALIVELDADDVTSRRERLIGGDAIFVLRLVGQRVGKHRLAVHQEAPNRRNGRRSCPARRWHLPAGSSPRRRPSMTYSRSPVQSPLGCGSFPGNR